MKASGEETNRLRRIAKKTAEELDELKVRQWDTAKHCYSGFELLEYRSDKGNWWLQDT